MEELVEIIARFTGDGQTTPLRCRLTDTTLANRTVPVNRVEERTEEKRGRHRTLYFKCSSTVGSIERQYRLKYEVDTCRWYLSG